MQNLLFKKLRQSMSFSVQLTDSARKDLNEVIEYIAKNLGNPIAANNLLDTFFENIELLSDNPNMYPLCKNERLQKLKYRKMVVDNYVFPYRVDSKKENIIIARVIYARRDYEKML